MKINKKLLSIMLVTSFSLALFACNSNNDTIIKFNEGAFIKIVDEKKIDPSIIECSYTESIDEVNDELEEIYKNLFEAAEAEGKTVAFDYKYLDVEGTYIYRIKFNDDAEHSIIYHNNFYKEYQQYDGCKICIIRVNDGEAPTYDTYDISENTLFKVTDKAYIFYGKIADE